MPHRRPVKTGSFGSHFDEMVRHFTAEPSLVAKRQSDRDPRHLREKRDIHALLFAMAWPVDCERRNGNAP